MSAPRAAEPLPWAPRPEVMPQVSRSGDGGLRVESNGSTGCYGGWDVPFVFDAELSHVVVSVRVRSSDLARGAASLEAMALWMRPDGFIESWAPLAMAEHVDEWQNLRSRVLDRPAGCRLVLRLLMRWSPTGWVEWTDWRVEGATPPKPRPIRLAAGSSPAPVGAASPVENRDRFLDLCRRSGDRGVDLLCLPETILSERVDQAVEIPGEHIEPFQSMAREYRMAIAFSVFERAGELVYNTGLLIDATGSLTMKYRKVHLAIREAWRGVTPGDEFVVARLEPSGAQVGLNVCMDSSSAESARLVAAAGADVLLLPIENDFRATAWTGTADASAPFSLPRWTVIQRAKALDNHLYVVAARNAGIGSGIFAPDGSVLAMDYGDAPLVVADVDLGDLRRHPTGPPYRDVIWYQRRPDAYGGLVPSESRER